MENEIVEYRLNNIEQTLIELKNVVMENKLQQKDIDEMKIKLKDFENRVNEIETRPLKEKASKWEYIIDYGFKALVTVCFGLLLYKLGLQ